MNPPQPETDFNRYPPREVLWPDKWRDALWTIVIVGIVVAVFVFAYLAVAGVNIVAVDYVSSDNACGLNGFSDSGFLAGIGSASQWALFLPAGGCTITSISAVTSGFGISDAPTPLHIPPGPDYNPIIVTLHCPLIRYTGVLTIDVE